VASLIDYCEKKFLVVFFVGDVISGSFFCPFGSGYLAWGATDRWKYFAQFPIRNYARIL